MMQRVLIRQLLLLLLLIFGPCGLTVRPRAGQEPDTAGGHRRRLLASDLRRSRQESGLFLILMQQKLIGF